MENICLIINSYFLFSLIFFLHLSATDYINFIVIIILRTDGGANTHAQTAADSKAESGFASSMITEGLGSTTEAQVVDAV